MAFIQATVRAESEPRGFERPATWLCGAVAAALAAFGRLPDPGVLGTYVAEYLYGTEQMQLQADGTFHQQFNYADGSNVTNAGKWSGPDATGQMMLEHFIAFDDGFGRQRSKCNPGLWAMAWEPDGGRPALRFNKAPGEGYRKQ